MFHRSANVNESLTDGINDIIENIEMMKCILFKMDDRLTTIEREIKDIKKIIKK